MSDNFFQNVPAKDLRYTLCRDEPHFEKQRFFIEELWRRYRTYCGDNREHFINTARVNYIGQLWHLFLANCFLENGYSLIPTKSNQPDICILIDEKKFWIEAVNATQGLGPDHPDNLDPVNSSYVKIPDPKILLRLAQPFVEKSRKFDDYIRKGVVAEHDYKIVAVCSAEVPLSDFSPGFSYMFRTLFGLGQDYYSVNRETGAGTNLTFEMPEIKKQSGSTVGLNYFECDEYRFIDAVLYSSQNPLSFRSVGEFFAELIPNPNSSKMLPSNFCSFFERWILEGKTLFKKNRFGG